MTAPHNRISAADLIAHWQVGGHLSDREIRDIADDLAARAAEDHVPLHLKLLTSVGTLIATAFFIACLAVADLIHPDKPVGLFVCGSITLGGGIIALLAVRTTQGVARDVLAQAAFAAMAVGKVLFCLGSNAAFGSQTPFVVPATLALLTAVTYPVAHASLDRFLSPLALFTAIAVEIVARGIGGNPSLPLSVWFAGLAVVAGGLLLPDRAPPVLRAIGTAALGAMGVIVAIIAADHDLRLAPSGVILNPLAIEISVTLALVVVVLWAARRTGAQEPAIAATLGIIALGAAGAPGILYALLLLVLGFEQRDRAMLAFGLLALPAFLVIWYYGRDMNFIEKSAVLVGSGVLLILARGYMAVRGFDRSEAP